MVDRRSSRPIGKKYIKDNAQKDPSFYATASAIAVQGEDGGPWTHGVIE